MTTSNFFIKAKAFLRLFRQAVVGEERDYTTGSIDRALFLLAVPMILEMAAEGVFAIVDIIYISYLNDNEAVATVGFTENMLTLV